MFKQSDSGISNAGIGFLAYKRGCNERDINILPTFFACIGGGKRESVQVKAELALFSRAHMRNSQLVKESIKELWDSQRSLYEEACRA